MKSSKIKVGHIYYVEFNSVKTGEFGKKHLAVVLKKNADAITFISIPLTSKQNGENINKISLGKLECLPENLKNIESFAVYDQIRTVSSERFFTLKENGKNFEAKLPDDKMALIYKAVVKDLLNDYAANTSDLLKELYEDAKRSNNS